MVNRRVEEEFCGNERNVVVCPGAGGSEGRNLGDVGGRRLIEDVL